MMVFVSITRLRIRSFRFMPPFIIDTFRTTRQLRHAAGYLGGSLLADRRSAFWTMTLWHDRSDMQRYITGGAHIKTMPKLLGWCDEASIVHWHQDSLTAPDWAEADHRMRTEGRPSKVRHPSPDHFDLKYAPPGTGAGVPIVPIVSR